MRNKKLIISSALILLVFITLVNAVTILSESSVALFSVYADSNYIYGGGHDDEIHVWNITDFSLVTNLTNATERIYSVYADSNYIYGASWDNNIYVWNITDFSLVTNLTNANDQIFSVYADSNYIYGASWDNNIYVWNITDFSLVTSLTNATGWMYSVYADSNYIYGASWDTNIYVWDITDFSLVSTLTDGTQNMHEVYADSDYIYGANNEGDLYIWTFEEAGLCNPPLLGDWSILASDLVSCEDKSITLNGSLNIWGNLDFNNVTYETSGNVNVFDNGNFTVHDSILNGSLNTFTVYGKDGNNRILINKSTLIDSVLDIDNGTTLEFLTSTSNDAFLGRETTNMIINNSNISALVRVFGSSVHGDTNLSIYDSNVYDLDSFPFSNVKLTNVNITNSFTVYQDSLTTIQNSTINDIDYFGGTYPEGVVNFTLPYSTVLSITEFRQYTEIHGYVDMPSTAGYGAGINIHRFYPVQVNYTDGTPASLIEVNASNSTGSISFSGTTDTNGFIWVDITFDPESSAPPPTPPDNHTITTQGGETLNITYITDTITAIPLSINIPNITSVIISPEPAYHSSTLTCDATALYADEVGTTTTYRWYKDGVDTGITTQTYSDQNPTDVINCTVNITDPRGKYDVSSDTILISNPIINTIAFSNTLSPSPVTLADTGNITTEVTSSDALKEINITWYYPNGTQISHESFAGGDLLTKTVTSSNIDFDLSGSYNYTLVARSSQKTKSESYLVTPLNNSYAFPESITWSLDPLGDNKSFKLEFWQQMSNDFTYTITIEGLNITYFNITSQDTSIILNSSYQDSDHKLASYLNISNYYTVAINGTYNSNITINRTFDNYVVRIPLTINVDPPSGKIEIFNVGGDLCDGPGNCDFDVDITDQQTTTTNYLVNNTGGYNLSNCQVTLTNDFVGHNFWTPNPDNFNLSIGEQKELGITFTTPTGGTYFGRVEIICAATESGLEDGLDPANMPEIVLTVEDTTATQDDDNIGGGQGAPSEPTTPPPTPTECDDDDGVCPDGCTSLTDSDCLSYCGDGIPDQNEDIFNCPEDVKFNLETVLSGESLKQNWFLKGLFVSMLLISVYLSTVKQKPKKRGLL